MKKIISLLLVLTLAAIPPAALADGEDIKIYIDGQVLNAEDANGDPVYPMAVDGTTYLPVRAIAAALGLSVEWDQDTRSVYLSTGEDDIANTENVFGNLGYFVHSPYDLLANETFMDMLRDLTGEDYQQLFAPTLQVCYASGNENALTLNCGSADKAFVNEAVIQVYKSGRIDAAALSCKDKNYENSNVIKYYSNTCPDYIDSESIKSFISTHVTGDEDSYNIISFAKGSPIGENLAGTYNEINGFGSFVLTANNGKYDFSGKIKRSENDWGSSSGTLVIKNGCTVCIENQKPNILFAFSGNYLTVIGLNDGIRPITSVCVRQ